jgi:GPI mannosyltransferase 3
MLSDSSCIPRLNPKTLSSHQSHQYGIGSASAEEGRLSVWPMLHALAATALVLRLIVAWWSERISFPDEVFQYLEQAHRLVYGYGFIPWEFRFGVRSWLLPGALAAPLEALRIMGLDRPTLYIPALKSIFTILSVCLVYANYTIGRNLFCERTGRIAAVITVIWYEFLFSSTLATPEVLGAYAIVSALAILTGHPTRRRAVLVGLLLGTSVALRLQYAGPATALWVLIIIGWGSRHALSSLASSAATLAFAGMLDAWSWGTPFISYYNNFAFNFLYGVSGIFGRKPLHWYIYALTLASVGLHALALCYGMLAWRRCWPILLLVACVLVPHSLIQHKEYRFVFLAVPLLLVLLADMIASGLPRLDTILGKRSTWPIAITIAAIAAVSVLGCAFRGVLTRDDRLIASLDLSRRRDLAAVLDLTGAWWSSGGFYYLHRNVPYYFKEQIDGLPITDIRSLASHVLVRTPPSDIPGFRVSARYGTIAILEQVSPPPAYRRLQKDGREPYQPGVDDRFMPNVRPRFQLTTRVAKSLVP